MSSLVINQNKLFTHSLNRLVEFNIDHLKSDWLLKPSISHPFYDALILEYFLEENDFISIDCDVARNILLLADRDEPVHFEVWARTCGKNEAIPVRVKENLSFFSLFYLKFN